MEAIFADSVVTGNRSLLYTYKQVANITGYGLGPVVAFFLFYYVGDTWTLPEMRGVMLVGLTINILPVFVTFFFDDNKSLGVESEGLGHQKISPPDSQVAREDVRVNDDYVAIHTGGDRNLPSKEEASFGDSPGETTAVVNTPEHALSASSATKSLADGSVGSALGQGGCIKQSRIAGIIIVSNTIVSIASGMTIKFFPVFYAKEVGLSPTWVCVTMVISTVSLALCTMLAQQVSLRIGRIETALAARLTGITLLFCMSAMKVSWTNPYIMVPISVVRMAFMNCQAALMQTVLMDYTKKEERARWSSLQTITQFGWSGSAMLGGWLLDHYGFEITFIITASLQLAGTLLMSTLLGAVARETDSSKGTKPVGAIFKPLLPGPSGKAVVV